MAAFICSNITIKSGGNVEWFREQYLQLYYKLILILNSFIIPTVLTYIDITAAINALFYVVSYQCTKLW
jgi:hypothetical protein